MSASLASPSQLGRASRTTEEGPADAKADLNLLFTRIADLVEQVLDSIQDWPLLDSIPVEHFQVGVKSLGDALFAYREFYRNGEVGTAHLGYRREENGAIKFFLRRSCSAEGSPVDPSSELYAQFDPRLPHLERIARRLSQQEVIAQLRGRIADDPDFPVGLHDQLLRSALAYRDLFLDDLPLMARLVLTETETGELIAYLQIIEDGTDEVRILHPNVYDGPASSSPRMYRYDLGFSELNLLDLERLAISDEFQLPELGEQVLEGPANHAAYQLAIYAILEVDRVKRVATEFLDAPLDAGIYSIERARYSLSSISNVTGHLAGMLHEALISLKQYGEPLRWLYESSDSKDPIALVHEAVSVAMFEIDNPLVVSSFATVGTEAARPEGHPNGFSETVRGALDILEVVKVAVVAVGRRIQLEGLPSRLPEESALSVARWVREKFPSKYVSLVALVDDGRADVTLLSGIIDWARHGSPDSEELIFRNRFSGELNVIVRGQDPAKSKSSQHAFSITETVAQGLSFLQLAQVLVDDVCRELSNCDSGRAAFRLLDVEHQFDLFVECHHRLRGPKFVGELLDGAARLGVAIDPHDAKILFAIVRSSLEALRDLCGKDPRTRDRTSFYTFSKKLGDALCMIETTFRSAAYLIGQSPQILAMQPHTSLRCLDFLRSQYHTIKIGFRSLSDQKLPADVIYSAALKAANISRYGEREGHLQIWQHAEGYVVEALDKGKGFLDQQGLPISRTALRARFEGHSNREGGGTGNQLLKVFADGGLGLATKTLYGNVEYLSLRGAPHPEFPAGQSQGSVVVSHFSLPHRKPIASQAFLGT